MKKTVYLLLIFISTYQITLAQSEKYKGIQGIGYLHTQTTLLLNNWDIHPLNHKPMDEHEAEFQMHLREEIQHDEEWVEYVLVEENLLHQFRDHITDQVTDAIDANISFYLEVLKALKDPELMDKNRDTWQKELVDANIRLYDVIYPALCK